MICYRDKTYCVSLDCSCPRKLTREVVEGARRWWGNNDASRACITFGRAEARRAR